MAYDSISPSIIEKYEFDYCRGRALELVAEEIQRNGVGGAVAEAGVAAGDFAKYINQVFPERTLYLYDTFEGFNEADKKADLESNYTSAEFFESGNSFGGEGRDANMENVRSKMKNVENCVFRAGWFPESAAGEAGETFAFVSIDMDLYEPISAALQFFYPRLSPGGYIFLHDYNHREFQGVKKAVAEFEAANGKLSKTPLPDQGGTLIIVKN
jgi:O-methyltransferase